MDREQDKLRFQGIDVFFESLRIISADRSILFRIALTFTLPLSFLFLFHAPMCNFLFKPLSLRDDDWTVRVGYFILLLLLSVPSTSTIACVVACSYSDNPIAYEKVIFAVPKLLEKFVLPFLFLFPVFFAHSVIAFFIAWLVVAFFFLFSSSGYTVTIMILGALLFLLYLIGVAYIGAIWQLATMVAMFEDCFEGVAIMKSLALIGGKVRATVTTFFVANIYLVGSQYLFYKYVVIDWSMGVGWKLVLTALTSVLICVMLVYWGVVQSVTYFVCKSNHHEDLDKSTLSNRLEVYVGNYVAVKGDDIPIIEQA